jgi:hypothetical protein
LNRALKIELDGDVMDEQRARLLELTPVGTPVEGLEAAER